MKVLEVGIGHGCRDRDRGWAVSLLASRLSLLVLLLDHKIRITCLVAFILSLKLLSLRSITTRVKLDTLTPLHRL